MKTLALACILTLCSCSPGMVVRAKPTTATASAGSDRGFTMPFWNDQRCYDQLQQRDGWTTAAKFLIGIGTATAITTPISDDKKVQWSIGASSAVVAAAGLAAFWMGSAKSDELEKYCSVDAPVPVSSPTEKTPPAVVEVSVADAGL